MAQVRIVGPTRRIRLEVCRRPAGRGDEVHAAFRLSSSELDGIVGLRVRRGMSVTAAASLDGLADSLRRDALDRLVVVAGILRPGSLDGSPPDSIRRRLEVDALGSLAALS